MIFINENFNPFVFSTAPLHYQHRSSSAMKVSCDMGSCARFCIRKGQVTYAPVSLRQGRMMAWFLLHPNLYRFLAISYLVFIKCLGKHRSENRHRNSSSLHFSDPVANHSNVAWNTPKMSMKKCFITVFYSTLHSTKVQTALYFVTFHRKPVTMEVKRISVFYSKEYMTLRCWLPKVMDMNAFVRDSVKIIFFYSCKC